MLQPPFVNIAGMLAGLSFGLMYKKFKLFLLPIGFLLAALSVFGMINSYSWMMIFIFAVLFNFVYSKIVHRKIMTVS